MCYTNIDLVPLNETETSVLRRAVRRWALFSTVFFSILAALQWSTSAGPQKLKRKGFYCTLTTFTLSAITDVTSVTNVTTNNI